MADLGEGNQSADSFAMSRNIFAPSVNLCFFAESHRAVDGLTPQVLNQLTSTWIQNAPGGAGVAGRRLRLFTERKV